MIRINLLGQARPRARWAAVPSGATVPVVLLIVSLVIAGGWVWFRLMDLNRQIQEQETRIAGLKQEKARLEPIKREVEDYEREKPNLEQRKKVIDELKRNQTGGQELLQVVADTVTRTDGLWLTNMGRRGNSLTFDGTAGSVTAVANFITQLKRSGYFEKIEIKESKQDDKNVATTTFLFSMTADFVLPPEKAPAVAAPGKS